MSEDVESEQREDSVDHPQLGSFLKYCSDDKDVIEGIFENHKIRFTQPSELNDPLEANPTLGFKDRGDYRWFLHDEVVLPSREWWIRLHLIQRRINNFGILSLTKVWDSFDMWSRYANGHKGFLLWLKSDFNEKPCMLSREGKPSPVRKVEYPPLHEIDMGELMDGQGGLRKELAYERLFFQKTSRWKAEREYRLVRPLSDLSCTDDRVHLSDFLLDCVEGVTFGACMSVEKKRGIIKACEGSGIRCSQAYILRDQKEEETLGGKMGKVMIAPPDFSSRLIDIDPCILDSTHIDDQKSKLEVSSLSELPYWNDDPPWIRELFENRKKRKGTES